MFSKKYMNIYSASLINFIFNRTIDNNIYAKIKNISTRLYITIIDKSITDESVIDDEQIKKSYLYNQKTEKKNKLLGNFDGTIFCIRTTRDIDKIIIDENKNYLAYNDDISAKLKISNNENLQNMCVSFGLCGDINSVYIKTNDKKNMFGEDGRFMYMSTNGEIFTDGSMKMDEAQWCFEIINQTDIIKNIRCDYVKQINEVNIESTRNISNMFYNRKFYLKNVGTNKFMNINFDKINNYGSIHNLYGDNEKTPITIRPDLMDNTVYLSFMIDKIYKNIYTIQNDNNVLFGAPVCNWAKFYLIKKDNYYMLMCYGNECDRNGNYGKYLCMTDDLNIKSNGNFNENNSLWFITN